MVGAEQTAAVRAIVEDQLAKYANSVGAATLASREKIANGSPQVAKPRISSFVNPASLEALRALSRSTDSKFGNTLEAIVLGLARLRYGLENCPAIAYGAGVSPQDVAGLKRDPAKQYIATFVDLDALLAKDVGSVIDKRGNLIDEKYNELAQNPPVSRVAKLYLVDLIYRSEGVWFTCELKSTGDLDSKNGPANAQKTFAFSLLLGPGTEARFGILQKEIKDSGVRSHIGAKHLIGAKDLWESVLPVGMTYDEFLGLVAEVALPRREYLQGVLAGALLPAVLDN